MLASLPQQSIHNMALPSPYGPTTMNSTGQPISLPNQAFHPQAQVPGVLTQVQQGMVQGIPGHPQQQRNVSQSANPNQPGLEGHGQPFAMQNGVMVARQGQMQKPNQMGMMPAGYVGMAGNFPQGRNPAAFQQQGQMQTQDQVQHLMQQRAAQQRQMVNAVMMNNGTPMQGMESNGTGGMMGPQRQQMGQPSQQPQITQQAQSATPQPSHVAQPLMGTVQRPPPTPGSSITPNNQMQGMQQSQPPQQGQGQGQGQQDGEHWDGEVM